MSAAHRVMSVVQTMMFRAHITYSTFMLRAETERLAAERLLEEAKALIEDARVRVDRDETEVRVRVDRD
jgi:nucleotide-binding universal stress UspA family protein